MQQSVNFKDFPRDHQRYRLVTAGAHRKPPPLVGAPALILHYGLWRPDCDDSAWHKAIDYFLYRVFYILRKDPNFAVKPVTPNYQHRQNVLYLFRHSVDKRPDDTSFNPSINDLKPLSSDGISRYSEQNTRYDVFSVRTIFRNIPITVRAELYSEFWNLDFICDFDRIESGDTGEKIDDIEEYTRDLEDIYKFIEDRLDKHDSRQGSDELSLASEKVSRARLAEIRRTLHRRFRDTVHNYITQECLDACQREQSLEIGTVFAEFHGAVFGFDQNILSTAKTITMKPLEIGNNSPRRINTITQLVGKKKFEDELAIRIVDAMWPFIKEIQRSNEFDEEDEERYGKPEFTVSKFQDGRAIYISSLGWMDPNPESQWAKPVVYTVIVSYRSRWSLGRLIERIHSMGSFRLAAMCDIEKITKVGDELKRIQEQLRDEESKISQNGDMANDINGDKYVKKCLRTGSEIKYGLMHRVERSQYYVKSFERHLEGLRCSRVEGFQPYDQFVKRRMYGAFDYIKRVGDRYRELRAEVELIIQKNNTASFKHLVGNIDSTVVESQKIHKEIEKVETRMASVLSRLELNAQENMFLQESAEFIIAIPLIYYLGHVISIVMKEENLMSYCISAVTAFLIIYILRISRERKREKYSTNKRG